MRTNNRIQTKVVDSAISTILLVISAGHVLGQATISLNNANWFVSNSNNSIVIPALVPGGIYSDLRRNDILRQDILFGKNDIAYRWVGNENWTYTTSFTIDHLIATSQSVKLVLHGIDTVSTILLNGQEIGRTDNMFVRYKFDLKPHLKLSGLQNNLVIKFESPIKYSAKKSHQSIRDNRGKIIPPYCPSPAQRGECHVNFIRKMQASFSWDWGPAFPSVGIYKDIEIEFGSFGMIRDLLVETRRLPPLINQKQPSQPPPPPILITSNLKQHLKPNHPINTTMPYIRAPPYYIPINHGNHHMFYEQPAPQVDIRGLQGNDSSSYSQLVNDNWMLKITLVAEMVRPSFGYNLRIEFSLNGILHYESEHINVVANSDGFIRLGFNLRIDSSRLPVKPWWPNNLGAQTLYKLTARMMPIPNPTPQQQSSMMSHEQLMNRNREFYRRQKRGLKIQDDDSETPEVHLASGLRPPQSPASMPMMIFLTALYDVNSNQVSEKEITFGFRTVELIQDPVSGSDPEDGLSFNFRINGLDIFAMGSNWIPASILPEYSNDLGYIRYLLQSVKDANMNMLRVWGGGLYESDEFYKMADEMGIMIWQDFMFACAMYPSNDEFLASVRTEIEQQVQRLQYHPSIVLWAGNNENEMAIAGPWWPEVLVWGKKLRESYAKLYLETIRPIVQILDPSRPFVESSPSNGIMSQSQPYSIARIPNDNKFGDVHHYDYLADSFDWTNYPSTRFASEYGFQSYPSLNTLTSISTPADWKYPLSANILHRQHRLTGETEMKLQIKMHFNDLDAGGLDKLKNFLYVSQLTQAIAIKTETEFYRRNRFIDPETKLGKTMGALYWQLNDVWQAPTWSSIEYGGKWKMLHYFARRFFFPVQVIPYLVQPTSTVGGVIQQAFNAGSSILAGLHNRMSPGQPGQPLRDAQEFQPQQQSSGYPTLVVDLVRDDLFYLLDSFNVTIKFYRWTSFTPIWQDTVYVGHTRPQNVTRIYEMDIGNIMRQTSGFSLTGGCFQVLIEQQPRLGLSQIENYLMPVNPSRVTGMRVPKIQATLIQGPFELSGATDSSGESTIESHQWSCAYRLTLVTDSVGMFVWLDLNFLNSEPVVDQPNRESIRPDSRDGGNDSNHGHPPRPYFMDNLHYNAGEHIVHQVPSPSDSSRRGRLMDASPASSELRLERMQRQQHHILPKFKPLEGTGSNMLRYQFSDNGFNMFEPSKVIDLYLNRCLSRAEIELALDIQSLANIL